MLGSDIPEQAISARVICPRCRVGEITYGAAVCPLCGYSPATGEVAVDPVPEAIGEAVRKELGSQFRIERQLGRGGMSIVYLARELELNRWVAVKVLPLQLVLGPDAADRFKREAKIGASLDHPHIVPIHRIGTTPTLLWYSMKWVKGGSLRDLLDKHAPMSVTECLQIVEPVAAALRFAHQRGVVHRDMKPANVLIDETGWVAVCDFGIAKMFGGAPLTNTGVTVGTPGYMAPEQCYGKTLDGRADQYSLAILVYECLTGRLPFTADSLGEIVRKHCLEPPPRITDVRPDVPARIADALVRAMNKKPEERFENLSAFVTALGGDPERVAPARISLPVTAPSTDATGGPTQLMASHRRRALFGWVAAAVSLLVLAGYVFWQGGRGTPDAVASRNTQDTTVPTAESAYLWVSSTPWGYLYVDGQSLGATPQVQLRLSPGSHTLRIVREGFEPYERKVEVAAGDTARLTAITLKRVTEP